MRDRCQIYEQCMSRKKNNLRNNLWAIYEQVSSEKFQPGGGPDPPHGLGRPLEKCNGLGRHLENWFFQKRPSNLYNQTQLAESFNLVPISSKIYFTMTISLKYVCFFDPIFWSKSKIWHLRKWRPWKFTCFPPPPSLEPPWSLPRASRASGKTSRNSTFSKRALKTYIIRRSSPRASISYRFHRRWCFP